MSIGNSIRNSSRWLITGSIGAQALTFLFGIVLARILVPADFGAIVTIQIFTGIAGYVAGAGTGEALVQAKKVKDHYFNVIFSLQISIGVLLFAFFFVFASWFGEWYGNPLYTDLMRVSAITFLTRPFAAIPMAKLRREMRFREVALISIAVLLGTNLVSIALALYGAGAWSFVLGGLAGSGIKIAILLVLTGWIPKLHRDSSVLKKLGAYGIKSSANEILFYIQAQTSNLFVSILGGASAVGLFNKADSLKMMPLLAIGQPVYQPIFRRLSEEQNDTDKSTYIYLHTITLLAVYMLPLYTGLFWTADAFITTVYGEKWSTAAIPLAILALCGPSFCIGSPSGAVIAAQDQLGKELYVGIANVVLIAAGAYIGYISYGIIGVAWALVAIELHSTFWFVHIATSSLNIEKKRVLKALGPGLLLNTILFAALLICDQLLLANNLAERNSATYLLVMTAMGGLSYAAAFLFLPISVLKPEANRWKKTLKIGNPT